MAEATSESINSLSSRLARNTFHPFLHRSVVYVGRPQFDALPPPPPPYIFPPSCRAHVGREHVAKEVCAARSARVLDNDGAQHIANHAWRAQQSGLKVVQIRDDDRPGNYQHLRLAIYRKRIYIYIFLLFLSFPFVQVLDYTQYYLNLPEANSGTANWLIEYSLLEYYNLQEITAISLHDLADRFTQFNDYAFVRYVEIFPKSLTLSSLLYLARGTVYYRRKRDSKRKFINALPKPVHERALEGKFGSSPIMVRFSLRFDRPPPIPPFVNSPVCAPASVSHRYYAANTVSLPREVEQIWGCGGPLNGACALHHYCTVTRLNPESYKKCYSSYAFALASTGPSTPRIYLSLYHLVLLACAHLAGSR